MIEEKILYNVLKNIGTGKEHDCAPDEDYLKALAEIGMISIGWDNEITGLGQTILGFLKSKLEDRG